MVDGKVRPRGRTILRQAGQVAILAAAIGLTGCEAINPINWYRDLTGASKNDPGPDEPNKANLEKGSAAPYPNLSTVPAIPTRGMTEAQREALSKGLIADRDHAVYTDAQIRNGDVGAVVPPQAALPEQSLPSDVPAAQPQAAPPVPETPHRSRLAVGGALGGGLSSAPAAPAPPAPPPPPAPPAPAPGPVAADRDSALQTPVPRSLPQPDVARPAPNPPNLAPVPPPVAVQPLASTPPRATPPGPSDVNGVPVPAAPPGRSEPTPPPAQLAAVPPGVPPASAAKRTKSAEIAEIAFAAGSNTLDAHAAEGLKDVPAAHQHYGGMIRIIGYATAASGGSDPAGQQLIAYQAALAHANAVKDALIAAGVPATEIVVEASPARGATSDRADVYVEY